MAFVGIEDKTGDGEVIVFPNLYEQIGSKLVQDSVIRATGKITARNRDGNLESDAKMIADEIQFVTDQELRDYEFTGHKMAESTTKPNKKVKSIKKMYVHIKDPDDHEALKALKQICSDYPGSFDIVLVLGDEKKSAIKLPFKIDANDALIGELVKILGEDSVVIK